MKSPWSLFGALLFGAAFSTFAQAASFTARKDSLSFPELNGSTCAVFHAPLRAPGPQTGGSPETVDLFVRKFPAHGHAKGSLWLISGGPGESGSTFYPFLKTLRAAFPDFDLLVPDHRGTGFSTRLCIKEESAGSPGGTALVGEEWGTCWASLNAASDYARSFSVTNAAFDLADLIAQYHGRVPTYVYGVSYGTQLVSRMLLLPHAHLDGVILDSLVAPDGSTTFDLSHRSQIVDAVGRKILDQCDAEPACRGLFDTTAEDAYRKLPASPPPGILDQVTGKNIQQFFGGLLDFPSVRARIPNLIAALNRGDTAELRLVNASIGRIGTILEQYPQAPPSIPLVSIISVAENDARPEMTTDEVAKEAQGMLFASSLPTLLVNPGLPLYPRDVYYNAAPKSLPRILVLRGTLDPKTPLDGATARIAQWHDAGRSRLVSLTGSPHFILMTSPICFKDAVNEFLADKKSTLTSCTHPEFRPSF